MQIMMEFRLVQGLNERRGGVSVVEVDEIEVEECVVIRVDLCMSEEISPSILGSGMALSESAGSLGRG